MLEDYYKRFDAAKGYESLLFRAGKGLQSAELNDVQAQLQHQVRGVADALLKDGDLLKGGELVIDIAQAKASIAPASIYLRGGVRELDASELTIAVDSVLDIGVWLTESLVTELEDPSLRDPAQGTQNYHEPGAGRLHVKCVWGTAADNLSGNFYPVFRVNNGVQIIKQPPPQLDSVTTAIARYDRETNGQGYVIHGLSTYVLDDVAGQDDKTYQVFSLSEGKAHVFGYEVEFPASIRKTFLSDPDLQSLVSEPHNFGLDTDEPGPQRIALNFSPIAQVNVVDITEKVTHRLTRGNAAGGSDPLPDATVLDVVEVRQGGTVFVKGSEYKLTGNRIDWSLDGNEPSTGDTYDVTYTRRTQVQPDAVDESGITISGAVPGSLVLVDYQWKMPRTDLMTLDKDGVIRRLKGVSHPHQPQAPQLPQGQLALAQIHQDWLADAKPKVDNLAVKAVPMSSLEFMQRQISDLYDLVAIERLRNDANAEEAAAKKGIFVDPFNDDSQRDQGLEQNAAVVDGELVLPIEVEVLDLDAAPDTLVTLEYELEPLLTQPMQTGAMKINPYHAFEPMPAQVSLNPARDFWTTTVSRWSSPITHMLTRGSGRVRGVSVTATTSSQVVSREDNTDALLRQRSVAYEIRGFDEDEVLSEIRFDGVIVYADDE